MENKIKKQEIENIYRIELMISSNWDMGASREIYVLEIKDEKVNRSLYMGKPLVPEYTSFTYESIFEHQRKQLEKIKNNELYFRCGIDSDELIGTLIDFKIDEWEPYNESCCIDGCNYDMAFYTKDANGEPKVYRYQFFEESLKYEYQDFFDKLFETVTIEELEHVTINEDMMNKSDDMFPGDWSNK